MGDQQETSSDKRRRVKREYRNRKRKRLDDYKKTLRCEICGENHTRCLEFHHIDPSTKKGHIADLIKDCSFELVMEEIRLCRVLCANCHRKQH
tara:strand:+ start:1819 stop:2097 length:279 start_codon:yes stop_codon:yes gene_type:complete